MCARMATLIVFRGVIHIHLSRLIPFYFTSLSMRLLISFSAPSCFFFPVIGCEQRKVESLLPHYLRFSFFRVICTFVLGRQVLQTYLITCGRIIRTYTKTYTHSCIHLRLSILMTHE